jgi:hypothetical protein
MTMSGYRQSVKEPFSEKVRLIRFRMKREEVRFAEEIRLVPHWLFWLMGTLYVLALVIALGGNALELFSDPENKYFPPGYSFFQGEAMLAAVITGTGVVVSTVLFLVGYVNQDAKRRGMNSALWTILVVMMLPGWLAIGFIIYFLVREPLPYHCTGCGAMVSARFNYCPNCKYNLRPTCRHCQREVGDRDRYCPFCGADTAFETQPLSPQ